MSENGSGDVRKHTNTGNHRSNGDGYEKSLVIVRESEKDAIGMPWIMLFCGNFCPGLRGCLRSARALDTVTGFCWVRKMLMDLCEMEMMGFGLLAGRLTVISVLGSGRFAFSRVL